MILVAGGTGVMGSLLVRRLVAGGSDVRVLTRDPARAAHLAGPHISVVVGDVRDAATLTAAVSGTDAVVSAVHGMLGTRGDSPATVDRDGNANLVEAAARAGSAVVLTSVIGAAADSPMELFRMKAAAEQQLREHSASWTVVRASAYLETWIGLLRRTAVRSGRPVVLGRGENPINFVGADDVAAVLAAVVDNAAYRGRVVEVGGPQDLTMNQLAAGVQAADGRDRGPRHVPRAALRVVTLLGRAAPARLARSALAMDTTDLTFPGPEARFEPPFPATTTAQSLLRPPAAA